MTTIGNCHSMVIAQAVHRAMWRLPSGLPSGQVGPWQEGQPEAGRLEFGLRGRACAVRCGSSQRALSVYVDDSTQINQKEDIYEDQASYIRELAEAGLKFSLPK